MTINGRTPDSVEAAIADIRARVPSAKLEKLAADNGTAAGSAETVRQFPGCYHFDLSVIERFNDTHVHNHGAVGFNTLLDLFLVFWMGIFS